MKVLLLPLLLFLTLTGPGLTLPDIRGDLATLPEFPRSSASIDHDNHNHHDHDDHQKTGQDHHQESYVYNASLPASPLCPMLYTRVGDRCIAFFTIAKVSWSVARQFCEGIFGQLWTFSDVTQYLELTRYIQDSDLDIDLWTGGREISQEHNTWVWLDNSSMPMGTPYWTIRSDSSRTLYGEVISYVQAPQPNSKHYYSYHNKRCAAMTSKYHFYLSVEGCSELKSPLCVLRKDVQVVMVKGSEDSYPAIHVPQATEGPTEKVPEKVPGDPDVEEEGSGYYIDGLLVDDEESRSESVYYYNQ